MNERRRLAICAIMFAGGIIFIGGWAFDHAGNVVNIFPWWVPLIGFLLVFGGIYLWLISR